MMFGAAVGAVGSGWLNFRSGRKYSLMIGAVLFVVGSLCSAFAPNTEVLIRRPRVAGSGGGCCVLYRATLSV